jgi:hypothetical protein
MKHESEMDACPFSACSHIIRCKEVKCLYLLWNIFVEQDVLQSQCNADKFLRNERFRGVNALLCQGQKWGSKHITIIGY